jgi:diguanylate cyclase (GGDEF)-like protein
MKFSGVSALLLGPPGRLRVRVLLTLVTLGIYCLFAMLQLAAVSMGYMDPLASRWLMGFYLLGSLGFYVLLRSGLSARLSNEPSLMLWQNVHSVLAVIWVYSLLGPVRGAVLAILVLIVAYGMFALSARQARWLTISSLVLLAAGMFWKSGTDPLRYPIDEEFIHLAISVIVLVGMSALSIRMGALRTRLRKQKRDLEASLDQIRLLATQDELTGLANRRHMTALLKAEQARQNRSQHPLSLVLIDLDHFKSVNDKYGHQAGDVILKGFAVAALSILRGSDILSRWGGEEFLLMLPDSGPDEAQRCVERMRQALASVMFDAVPPDFQITFSAGLSVCHPNEPLEAAVERADHAMYRAKAEGRNRTVRG